MNGYFYAAKMRGWVVKHRNDMERLARSRDDLKEALIYLSDPARYDKTVTVYADAVLAADDAN